MSRTRGRSSAPSLMQVRQLRFPVPGWLALIGILANRARDKYAQNGVGSEIQKLHVMSI